MRMDRLTSKFSKVRLGAEAQSLALGRDHQFIEPVHIMLALMNQDGGTVRPLLQQLGVNIATFRTELNKLLEALPEVQGHWR